MANTVTILNYANTFGDWLVATDALIAENNTLASGDYTKNSGTLYLNETTQNSLQANGNIVVQKQLLVQGTGSSATIQNNLTVGGQIYFTNTTLGLTHTGQANLNGLVLVQGPGTALQVSNNASIGGNITINGNEYVGGNTTIRYNTITNTVQANTSVNTTTLTTTTSNTSILNLTTKLDGNNATGYLNALIVQGGGLTVNGNFILTGTTVYASNTFQLSTGVSTAIDSYFNVDRGLTGIPASFRWNESSKYWDILNVSNSTYYRVLTNEYINDTLTSTSTTNVASANSVNAVNNNALTAGSYANSAFLQANSAYASQNTTGTYANSAYNQANTATTNASAASSYANSAFLQANSAYASQNTTGTYANSAYNQANTATTNASAASSYANSAFTKANTGLSTLVGTTGSATTTSSSITLTSTNGITFSGSGNTITANTAQDIRTSASPTFAGMTLNGNAVLKTFTLGSNTLTATTANTNLDLSIADVFVVTLNANSTFTFTNPPSSGVFKNVLVVLIQDAVGNKTATFTNARYTDGVLPVLTTTANAKDVLSYFTYDSGSNYFGSFVMADVK